MFDIIDLEISAHQMMMMMMMMNERMNEWSKKE
jgi:hypothetical protein